MTYTIGTDNKQVVLGTCIRFLIEEGLTVQEAIDAVLGAGRFEMIKNGISNCCGSWAVAVAK